MSNKQGTSSPFHFFGQQPQRGRCPVEYRGNLCIRPSVHPSPLSQPTSERIWSDRWTDRRTDVHTDSPCILQDIVPFGSAAQKRHHAWTPLFVTASWTPFGENRKLRLVALVPYMFWSLDVLYAWLSYTPEAVIALASTCCCCCCCLSLLLLP